jgi:hypothetical protein
MPTYEAEPRFLRDYSRLTKQQKDAFDAAVAKFVTDLKGGRLRKSLRVKAVQGHDGVYEMAWAPDGRATFSYGQSVRPGEVHVIWRRCGTHDIFALP